MKIRKALAVVLSLAMTVTLMPATAFASTAKVASVVTVKDGAVANTLVRIELENPLAEDDPQTLTLDVTQHGEFAKFNNEVTLAGKADDATTKAASVVVGTINDAGTTEIDTIEGDVVAANAGVYVKATSTSKKSMDLTLTYNDGTGGNNATLPKETTFYFYMNIEADGSDGDEIQVSLDGDAASVIDSFSAKTVAIINDGGTTATADEDAPTVGRGTGIDAAEVTIKEIQNDAVVAAVDGNDVTQTIVLTLPKGVTWSDDMKAASWAAADEDIYSGNMINTAKAFSAVISSDNARELTVTFVANGKDTKEKLILKPVINVTKDANKGNIKLKIDKKTGNISDASDLVIAVYGDANVNILCKDADDLPEIVSGKEFDKDNDAFVVSVTFEENSEDALTSGKYIDLAFNTDSVQVLDSATNPIKYFVGDKYAKKEYKDGKSAVADGLLATGTFITDLGKDKTEDRSEFTLTVPADNDLDNAWKDEANTLTLFIPVTVSADYVGDITLTAKGNAGIDETTVTVAKAVAPVTVTTSVTNVVNGAQSQATADITITENFAGALKDSKLVSLSLDDLTLGGMVFKNDAKATVTAGDLEIKDSEKSKDDGRLITFKIDEESTVASTVVVSGLAVNLGRTLPEGEYNLKVGGSALVENNLYNGEDFSKNAVKGSYINITTAADTAQSGIVATFSLDGTNNSTYTVNGATATMDAAAYLDSNNRTMVPIRYVGYALGLTDTDISYNVGDSTATLSGLTNVVKVTTGSNVLQCSNGNVTMDTVAVNNSGRLYVPARFIAQSMGAQVAWDQATKTVTITK